MIYGNLLLKLMKIVLLKFQKHSDSYQINILISIKKIVLLIILLLRRSLHIYLHIQVHMPILYINL